MKLKPIQTEIAVHTPTEEAANELLAILHENGYKWLAGNSLTEKSYWSHYKGESAYHISPNMRVEYGFVDFCVKEGIQGLSLDEFKRMYCEEEAPNLQGFAEGTLLFVRKKNDFEALLIMLRDNGYKPSKEYTKHLEGEVIPAIEIMADKEFRFVPILNNAQITGGINGSAYLELLDTYAMLGEFVKNSIAAMERLVKPEIKPTEDMEENKEINKEINKELNLCELLKGHEGELFYSPICGTEIELKNVYSSFLSFHLDKENGCTVECNTKGNQNIGTLDNVDQFQTITYPHSSCMVYPSKPLYEQYPLDAYTAWMKWQEEQTIYHIRIDFQPYDERGEMKCGNMGTFHFDDLGFRSTADRDKCIEEIKAIIEKYSNK